MLSPGLFVIAASEGSVDPSELVLPLIQHALPHVLFSIGPLQVTGHMVSALLAAILVLATFFFVASRVRVRGEGVEEHVTRGRFAQTFEAICVFIREEVVRPNLGKLTDRYIYYIWTVFFFILFCNLLGMIPLGALTQLFAWGAGADHPAAYGTWLATATSTLSLNAPLALCSFIAVIYIGVRESGKHFFAHFAPVPFKPLAMAPIAVLLVVMEVMSITIRCGVLAMRLFGTMLAGHVAIGVLIAMIFVFTTFSAWMGGVVGIGVLGLTLALSLLELFIALIQAFIFTFLTVLFVAEGAVHDEDHGPHEEPGGGPAHQLEERGFVATAEHSYDTPREPAR